MGARELVEKLPAPLLSGISHLYGAFPARFRFGKSFWDTYGFLQKSQYWSKEDLQNYQMEQLRKLLEHAYINVPYYKKLFDVHGIKTDKICGLSDLKQIPFLDKKVIQDNLQDMRAQNFTTSRIRYVTTGGSTGIPMGFYEDKVTANLRETAFMTAQWERVGFKLDDRVVVLRGNIVPSADKGKPWQHNPVSKSLILSSYHMTDAMMINYIKLIKSFKPLFIRAYPSALTILAQFMKNNGIGPFPGVQALLCGSENLYGWQRQLFEEVFKTRIYSWYGHSEKAILAGECECSENYHVFPEYGCVEIIDSEGKVIAQDGEIGEIVATGFSNYVTPFIRYRTMDLAALSNAECRCGRKYPLLIKVSGRLQEFILTKKNRYISMTAINMHSDVFDNVKQFQFYQEKRGEVVFNLVKKESYTDNDTDYIRKELQKKLGNDVELFIRIVDQIPRTPSGKHRFLVQKLSLKFGE
jgi:phenylacetate-CoA ligase